MIPKHGQVGPDPHKHHNYPRTCQAHNCQFKHHWEWPLLLLLMLIGCLVGQQCISEPRSMPHMWCPGFNHQEPPKKKSTLWLLDSLQPLHLVGFQNKGFFLYPFGILLPRSRGRSTQLWSETSAIDFLMPLLNFPGRSDSFLGRTRPRESCLLIVTGTQTHHIWILQVDISPKYH